MDYPIFLRHPEDAVFYQIDGGRDFKEWKRLGPSKAPDADIYIYTVIKDADYATSLYIQDLMASAENGEFQMIEESLLVEILEGVKLI